MLVYPRRSYGKMLRKYMHQTAIIYSYTLASIMMQAG